MKKQTADVFHAIMKKGWIERSGNIDIWRYCEDAEVQEELEVLKEGLGFELIRSGDRIYLVPTQDNDLFLKNNVDYRKDISASSEVRTRDLYLMNYLSIYLIYIFYHGEGSDPKCREFISREDAIKDFSDHCRACIGEDAESGRAAGQTDQSDNFIRLANTWLSKTDGAADSMKFSEHYGILNRLLVKYNAEHDDLFYIESGNIHPSRKLDDLIPYFLRRDRIHEMHEWLKEVNDHAADI